MKLYKHNAMTLLSLAFGAMPPSFNDRLWKGRKIPDRESQASPEKLAASKAKQREKVTRRLHQTRMAEQGNTRYEENKAVCIHKRKCNDYCLPCGRTHNA